MKTKDNAMKQERRIVYVFMGTCLVASAVTYTSEHNAQPAHILLIVAAGSRLASASK